MPIYGNEYLASAKVAEVRQYPDGNGTLWFWAVDAAGRLLAPSLVSPAVAIRIAESAIRAARRAIAAS